MKRLSGFTLIELMVVIMIVAVIAAIAYPSYQTQVMTTRRTDAHRSLMDISARLERFMIQRNGYTTDFGPEGLGLESSPSANTLSDEGFYTIAIAACNGGTIANCYRITATATGTQSQDTECAQITLNNTGVRSGTTVDACW